MIWLGLEKVKLLMHFLIKEKTIFSLVLAPIGTAAAFVNRLTDHSVLGINEGNHSSEKNLLEIPAYPIFKDIYYRELMEPPLTFLGPPAASTGTLYNLVLLPQILPSPLVSFFNSSQGTEEPLVASCLFQF